MLNKEYWSGEGALKTFTHPLLSGWMDGFDRTSSVLDAGCGYGRLTPELKTYGFDDISGFDFSRPLIERALKENPGAFYTCDPHALEGRQFGLVLCFALFTSCPVTRDQADLISWLNSLTPDGAFLYISDYETSDNPDYENRYNQRELGVYGCFRSGKGIFRHHESGHFDALLAGWFKVDERTLESTTLNGNAIRIHQYLYRKRC